jgi:hypothetical protein
MTTRPAVQRSPGVAPAHGRRFDLGRPMDRATAVAVAAAGLLALLIISPNLGPAPGDPSAFASDARFVRCGGTAAPVQYAFEIPKVSEYQAYLPAMGLTSELGLDKPALIVIFRDLGPFVVGTAQGSPEPTRSPVAGRHDMCVYVGPAGAGELNFYTDVPTAGLRVKAGGPAIEP